MELANETVPMTGAAIAGTLTKARMRRVPAAAPRSALHGVQGVCLDWRFR